MAAPLIWPPIAGAVLLAACSAPATDAAMVQTNAAAPAKAMQVTDRATLGGREVQLLALDGRCVLRREGAADAELAPTPPCRFLRADGQVQQFAYPARKVDAVVYVAGSTADARARADRKAPAGADCGTVAHGLIVRGQVVTVSQTVQRDALVCYDIGRDEKDFYTVAHSPDLTATEPKP